jgi:phosphatidate cytidylyltransferase
MFDHLLPDLLLIYSLVFGLLILASAIGQGLVRFGRTGNGPTVQNLNARINAWWIMIIVLALAMAAGRMGVVVLFAFISFQCLREFITLTNTRRGDHRALLWSFFFFLPLQYYFIAIDWYMMFTILIPVYAFLLLPISETLGQDTSRFLERAAKVQWGLMVTVYCLSHIPALINLDIPGHGGRGMLLVVFLILVVQSSDVFQYIWGKLFGRRKISPNISPSKTYEGLIGGIASSTALGACLYWMTPFTMGQAALVALTINIAGFFGGFVLSAIKRDRGVKDWGSMIEGHGGMLDRVDSLSFAAPIFFHIVRYWWTP